MNDFVERLDEALEAVIGRPGMSYAVMKRMGGRREVLQVWTQEV